MFKGCPAPLLYEPLPYKTRAPALFFIRESSWCLGGSSVFSVVERRRLVRWIALMKSLKMVRVTFVVLFGWLAGVNFTAEQGAETGAFLSQSRLMMIAKMCHEFLTAPVQHENDLLARWCGQSTPKMLTLGRAHFSWCLCPDLLSRTNLSNFY
jgi:hypothetical protein